MKRLALSLLLLLAAVPAFGQTAVTRWNWMIYTTNGSAPKPGGMIPVVALPGARVQICATWVPGVAGCSTLAATYTDQTGTTLCPSNMQLTPAQGTSGCTAYADADGGIGAYLNSGNYAYVVFTNYGTFGPYLFGVGYENGGSIPASAPLLGTNSARQLQSVTVLPESAEPAHTGDVTNTAGSTQMTVTGINNTQLSSLTTGLLKNTTGTGVPSIAVAGTDYVAPTGQIFTGPVAAPTLGGISYAKENQTGSGNNGIINSATQFADVMADPSYTASPAKNTETETLFGTSTGGGSTTLHPWTATALHVEDTRWGFDSNLFVNQSGYLPDGTYAPYGGMNPYPINGDNFGPWAVNCLFTQYPQAQAGTWRIGCGNFNQVSSAPGWSMQNGTANWQTTDNQADSSIVYGAGISETLGLSQYKYGIGDNAAMYIYDYGEGGYTAPSDEAQKGFGDNVYEDTVLFQGTCSTGCTSGSTQIAVTGPSEPNAQGVGRMLIDLGTSGSAAPYSGNVTNIASGLGAGSIVTVNTTVPVSTEWGTLAATVTPPLNTNPPFTTPETFTVNLVGGATGQFNAGDLVCFGGGEHECENITSVAAPSGSTQSITMPVRTQHASGAYLFANGMANYCWEQTGYTELISGTSYKYCLDVIGSIASNELEVQSYEQSAVNGVPFSATVYDTMNITALSCTNSACSGTINNSGTLYQPYAYNGAFLFSGATDAALNTYCTGFQWSSQTAFTCTISGLSGTYGPETATGQLAYLYNGSYAPLSQFQLWPQAEVLDVQNETLTQPIVDGSLTLEPNQMPLTTTSIVQEPHHEAMKIGGGTMGVFPNDPYDSPYGLAISMSGSGVGGGGNGPSFNSILSVINGQPDSYYLWDGGTATPVNGMNIEGRLSQDILFNEFPSGAVIDVPSVPSWQTSNPNFNFEWISAPGMSWTENAHTYNNGIVAGGTMTMYGTTGLTLGTSGAPSALSGSTITLSGGPITAEDALTVQGNLTQSGAGSGSFVNSLTGSTTINNLTATGTLTLPTSGVTAGTYASPSSVTVGADGRITAIAAATHGIATLAAGTVTVSTTAACTPGSTCTYSLTNCGIGSSTAIGTLTLGTVTAGTSFVVNSESSTATVVTGDLSSVCWKIN